LENYKLFSVIAGIVFVSGFIPYILAIFGKKIVFGKKVIRLIPTKKTKPAKASWLIWAVLDSLALAGMIVEGTVNGQIVGAVLCASFVFVLALRHGKKGWTLLDKACLASGFLGGVLWVIYMDATPGIIVASAALFIGSFPTFASAWKNPEHEDKIAWTIFWVSCIFAFLGAPKWNVDGLAQPISFFVVESIMMYILYVRARKFKKA